MKEINNKKTLIRLMGRRRLNKSAKWKGKYYTNQQNKNQEKRSY